MNLKIIFSSLAILAVFNCWGENQQKNSRLRKDSVSQKAVVQNDHILKIHSTMRLEPLTEELIRRIDCKSWANAEGGYSQWLLTFNEIPGIAPYSLQQKRVAQENPDLFTVFDNAMTLRILGAKFAKKPFQFPVSARGFLLGEPVTIRLATKDKKIYREITICPRPLVLRKDSGEILMKATLNKHPYQLTAYDLEFTGIGKDEKFEFISISADERIETTLEGPIFINFTPGVLGVKGGVAKLELRLKDGSSYRMELPWGSELSKYNAGLK